MKFLARNCIPLGPLHVGMGAMHDAWKQMRSWSRFEFEPRAVQAVILSVSLGTLLGNSYFQVMTSIFYGSFLVEHANEQRNSMLQKSQEEFTSLYHRIVQCANRTSRSCYTGIIVRVFRNSTAKNTLEGSS